MTKNIFHTRLCEIKKILTKQKIDHFILPNSDEFFLEYLPESEKRIQYLSGFNGSNATIIIGQKKSTFFTDGRYTLQAKTQLNLVDYQIFNIAQTPLFSWLKANLKKSQKIAIDAKLFSINFVRSLQKIVDESGATLVFVDENPVDKIWSTRPNPPSSKIFEHKITYSGKASSAKAKEIISTSNADAIFFNQPESICWLLNIRASDVEFTPLLAAYAILYKDGKIDLFTEKNRFEKKLNHINIISPSHLESTISKLGGKIKKIQIDPATTNFAIYKLLSQNFTTIEKPDPALLSRSCKNKTEIAGAIRAHEIDGLALTKFLFWLEKNHKNTDELKAQHKLLELRKQHPDFIYPSFNSISSFAANGAVIHYHATAKTNKKFTPNSLYLIDSGGQYYQGTTDVTRVVAIGKPTKEMKNDFTLVLKGHIALATAKFPQGTSGSNLDALARIALWKNHKDYDHGTGHGVGSFLSVHEGPQAINKRNTQELLEGMIISNEPGYYLENAYGIRIESLMLVEKSAKNFLQFRTLTLAPIDFNLINFNILTQEEIIWLKNYHKKVFLIHKNFLNAHEKAWLQALLQRFENILKKAIDK